MTKIPTTMNEEWIEQMRQKMADYQWPAPELSWDELDQTLTANKPRKTRVLWLHRIAAAAVILRQWLDEQQEKEQHNLID